MVWCVLCLLSMNRRELIVGRGGRGVGGGGGGCRVEQRPFVKAQSSPLKQ
jgi:hypothetical protein